MKIVSINSGPKVSDAEGTIRPQVTDLNTILNNIDPSNGRNDAIRNYVYALRDLQIAFHGHSLHGDSVAKVKAAQAVVREAFDRLISAEFSLNRAADNVSTGDAPAGYWD